MCGIELFSVKVEKFAPRGSGDRVLSPDQIEISLGYCIDPTVIPFITAASNLTGGNDQRGGERAAAEGGVVPARKPTPGSWSVGQCLEHLCITNEAYLPPISVAVNEKPDSPVEQITPGWFGRWFIRSFIEPSPVTKRAPAPAKIRPTAHVGASVLERFLDGNESCRELMVRARAKNVNRIRFWNPFIPGIRFTVGTGLQIIVGHERRHLLQAERVLHSASFSH